MNSRRRTTSTLCLLALVVPAGSAAAQSNDISLGVRASTLGIGVELAKLVSPNIGVRIGANSFTYTTTRVESEVTYDAELKFKSFTGLVDLFLSKRGSFHLTGGVMTEPAEVSGVGQPTNSSYQINGVTYTAAEVGTVTAVGEWPSLMPYAGLGWGTPANSGGGLGVVFDLGVAIGKPTIALSASSAIPGSNLAADVAAEQDELQDEINKYFEVYPVISLGLVFRF